MASAPPLLICNALKAAAGTQVCVRGWVRSVRKHARRSFIQLNDGTTPHGIQIICDHEKTGPIPDIGNGASISVDGQILLGPSKRNEKELEVAAESLALIGHSDAAEYPVQKKHHTMEFLRKVQHFRGRTAAFSSVLRIRNTCSMAIHEFFQNRDFQLVHTPIITGCDCEGAGEQFRLAETDPTRPFFGQPAFLTVSGQLHAEMFACSIGPVYTFGPTFRRENSHTRRHLSEFWMVEPEIPYATLNDIMDTAEGLVKYCVNQVQGRNGGDVEVIRKIAHTPDSDIEDDIMDTIMRYDFARVSYTRAIEILQKAAVGFAFTPEWGHDLQTEHELFLCKHFNSPVFVTDFPAKIKPFYMKASEKGDPDKKTCASVDLLVPNIGELVGGSERIDDPALLMKSMGDHGVDPSELQWYLDLRRFGSVPHGGFGLGFDRLVQAITGTKNIRDVMPVPRIPSAISY
ncbi:asparagine--tRNA ligase [Plasmodiophora brassicae]|uniref:asparagine--tRNA ligase n=1 Tax=Plasmodiophora brassicae TaxID=37360 RepID=A0A0G4IRN2_PLABS|nr:hypothetical protein PBRA_005923 [Plasmodiophora brassicae]SPQ98354.1 unnamed protein product [Plasmodiophora brassicae]